jgi:putative spermidine/putrescine transport system permease protein
MTRFAPYTSAPEKAWYYAQRCIGYGVLAFLLLPVLAIIPLSFSESSFLGYPVTGFSFKWYEALFASPEWTAAMRNSFIVAPAATALAVLLGVPCATGLNRGNFPGRGVLLAVILSPIVTPIVVVAVGMYFFYSDIRLDQTYAGLILAHALLGAPFVVTTVLATLKGFDQRLAMASASLGASRWQTFRRITLPLILPGVLTGAIFAFAVSFDEVVVTLFLAGPQQTTIPRQMFSGIRDDINPTILALSTLLTVLTTALFLALQWLKRRSGGKARPIPAQTPASIQ